MLQNQSEKYFTQNKIKKIAILTPYPQWLQEHAMRYWTEQGIEVVATEQVDIGGEDTYKIYELSSNDAKPGLINLMEADCEANFNLWYRYAISEVDC